MVLNLPKMVLLHLQIRAVVCYLDQGQQFFSRSGLFCYKLNFCLWEFQFWNWYFYRYIIYYCIAKYAMKLFTACILHILDISYFYNSYVLSLGLEIRHYLKCLLQFQFSKQTDIFMTCCVVYIYFKFWSEFEIWLKSEM